MSIRKVEDIENGFLNERYGKNLFQQSAIGKLKSRNALNNLG